ncbi:MAG: hypothetical protein WBE40_04065 [Thermoplasmata archaeon]
MEKKQRTKVLAGSLVAGVAVLVAISALAAATVAGASAGIATQTYTCAGNSEQVTVGPPSAHDLQLVVSVTWKAVNDEDSGVVTPYWAMDSYTTTLHVWKINSGPDAGTYYWTQTFKGSFQTPQGAISPQNGAPETASGYGTLVGGLVGTIAGTEFVSPTTANLGTLNYGGTTLGILNGTGDANEYNWEAAYFSPANPSDFVTTSWGFLYNLAGAFQTNSHGDSVNSTDLWCNFGAGNYGDIVTAS